MLLSITRASGSGGATLAGERRARRRTGRTDRPRPSVCQARSIAADATPADPPPIEATTAALRDAWSQDTSDDPDRWTEENRALGQCAVSSLVIRALYGGEILIATVLDADGERTPDGHAWNRLPDGAEVDCSFDQFRAGERLAEPFVTEPVIDGDSTRAQRLADRVGAALGVAIDVGPVDPGV